MKRIPDSSKPVSVDTSARITSPPTVSLQRQLRAIHLSRDSKGAIASFPIGARVAIVAPSTQPGFVEVICANVHYDVLGEDLRDCGFEVAASQVP